MKQTLFIASVITDVGHVDVNVFISLLCKFLILAYNQFLQKTLPTVVRFHTFILVLEIEFALSLIIHDIFFEFAKIGREC